MQSATCPSRPARPDSCCLDRYRVGGVYLPTDVRQGSTKQRSILHTTRRSSDAGVHTGDQTDLVVVREGLGQGEMDHVAHVRLWF